MKISPINRVYLKSALAEKCNQSGLPRQMQCFHSYEQGSGFEKCDGSIGHLDISVGDKRPDEIGLSLLVFGSLLAHGCRFGKQQRPGNAPTQKHLNKCLVQVIDLASLEC